ncbi:hypothetical protein [Roseicitreum antarcticum]|uniref:Uncharacterized protein n=1 Tax=Roseicitreum antarcticum TaxID=564137 RepID=A0A1H3E5R0_9RHOB|nr:hypothetical protein [Roseicitreum antarcticum]SDX73960.1 hypothetical protein SAMN04488238_11818 [Roseicitreum antarcticum]
MVAPIRIAQFLPYVMPHAPGAPDIVAEKYIRMAAIEFCERTRCWRHLISVDLTDQTTEAMIAPYYAAIHEIEYASFTSEFSQKRALTPTQFSDVSKEYRPSLETGQPEYVTQTNPNHVTVLPLAAGTLELSVFLKPRMGQQFGPGELGDPIQDDFNVVPDFLLTQWGEAVACGALSKLLMVPQQRWTDPKMGGFYLTKFERACDKHFSQSIRGQQRKAKRTRFSFM